MAKKNIFIEAEPVRKFIKPKHIIGKKYYLYIHTRDDNNDLFYVGIGTMDKGVSYLRSLCYKKRNIIWQRIVGKIPSYTIFIVHESDNKQEVLDKEIQYIKLMGKKCNNTGCLSNLTDGGEGSRGYKKMVWTEEMRNKIREANKRRIISDSTREKLRIALKARGIINKPKNAK